MSRLAPSVTMDDIKNSGVNTDVCIELTLKCNTYKSYKIGLNENLTSTVLSADFWPAGSLIQQNLLKNKGFLLAQEKVILCESRSRVCHPEDKCSNVLETLALCTQLSDDPIQIMLM